MENSKNRNNEYLGVNKVGKNIRKSPLHQPNFANNAGRPVSQPPSQPQPQVYNISKNDFRDIVQQLTGSPSHSQERPPRPTQNSPKPQSMRLQKIRPPPLAGLNRPHIPSPMPVHTAPPPLPQTNLLPRPVQFGQQPSATTVQPLTPPGNSVYAESPISAYMRYLQHSMQNPSPIGGQPPPQAPQQQPQPQTQPPPQQYVHPQTQAQMQPQSHSQSQVPNNMKGQVQPPSFAVVPNPTVPAFPNQRMSGPTHPFNGPVPNLPSPQMNVPSFLPSPTSQFLLPSPNGYMNLLSPRSPYPLLSPGAFPPLTPNFAFSPTAQSGFFGLGPQPPPSPGLSFPLSPSGFFPVGNPRWRDH